MIKLRKPDMSESQEILDFYRNLILSIKYSEFKPKWNEKYPNLEFIENSILKEEMYVYSEKDIIACVVVNNEFGEDYDNVEWSIDVEPSEIIVIHTFAVNSIGKGIGKEIFNKIQEKAIKNNKKTIRIDVIDGNEGAKKVFKSLGFKYIDSIETFHEAVGLETFDLYEKILKTE